MNELYYQIDNTKLSEYLTWELINQEDLTTVTKMMQYYVPKLYNTTNYDINNEKKYYAILMYSIYNEILSIIDIKNIIASETKNEDNTAITSHNFTDIIGSEEFSKKLNSKRVYKLIDFISTFTFDNYKNMQNIENQLLIIYTSLNDDEINFLKDNTLSMKDLVRLPNSESNRIEHAKIESSITIGSKNYTDILNGSSGSIFRSILLKISKFKL